MHDMAACERAVVAFSLLSNPHPITRIGSDPFRKSFAAGGPKPRVSAKKMLNFRRGSTQHSTSKRKGVNVNSSPERTRAISTRANGIGIHPCAVRRG